MNIKLFVAVVVVSLIAGAGLSRAAQSPGQAIADLALSSAPDRERILLEGAKKEGAVTFYTSNTWIGGPVAQEFGRKYPFVKISVYRADSITLLKRLLEEFASARHIADVAETSPEYVMLLQRNNMLQEHASPELAAYPDNAKVKGKRGVYAWTDREIYISLGFNTGLIPARDAPKSTRDLADPRWKGKMSIAGTTTGVQWVGAVNETFGREFLEKLSAQEINVQNISGAALAELIAGGEVPMSPTIFNSNIYTAKQKGAPVEWRPLDPVIAGVGTSGMLVDAPHPYAALLLLDFLHSKEGQRVGAKGGLSSARTDMASGQPFKKIYLESMYTPQEYEKKFTEWEGLLRRLFIRQR